MVTKLLRVSLAVAMVAYSLPCLNEVLASGTESLDAASVASVRVRLAALGLDLDEAKQARSENGETTVRILGFKDVDPSRSPRPPEATPFAVLLLERQGLLENVQTLSIEKAADGPALIIDSTPADHPDFSVRFRISRVYDAPRIELSAMDHLTGQQTFLGVVEADPGGGIHVAQAGGGCIRSCINTLLSGIGFWGAIGLACWVIGAGIVGIVGGATTLGAATALVIPILKACLEIAGILAGAATVGAVAGCITGCVF